VKVWDGTTFPLWMKPGWGGPYGGYLVPGYSTTNLVDEETRATSSASSDKYAYWTLSLWTPYRVFQMKVDLSPMLNITESVSME